MKTGLNFTDWHKSKLNPLSGCSAIADAFTKDALKAAFDAGMEYRDRLVRDARVELRKDNFSFDSVYSEQLRTGDNQ